MSRRTVSIRPIFVIAFSGDVEGSRVEDIALDSVSAELSFHLYRGSTPKFAGELLKTVDILEGVDTYDANVIRLLENISAAVGDEARQALMAAEDVTP